MIIKEFEKRILSSIILLPLSFFFIIKGSLFFTFFLILCLLITSYEWFKMSKNKKYLFFGYFFLLISFYSAYSLRINFLQEGLIYFLLVLIICISTDVGGYIFGKILKGPKLTKFSPKKTFSGMIGGYILSIASLILIKNYSNYFEDYLSSINFKIILLVLIISTISQLGDIIISIFKRISKVKDTGNLIPGHGGLLDRIDGMLFAFPVSYIIFLFIF